MDLVVFSRAGIFIHEVKKLMKRNALNRMFVVTSIAILFGCNYFIDYGCCDELNVPGISARIHDIQGATHYSPLAGSNVSKVPGIVTAIHSNGFYMQDPNPDSNNSTSEGIFVYTKNEPNVKVGDYVLATGIVTEYRDVKESSRGLNITELSGNKESSAKFEVESSDNPLPDPIVLGVGGREPPHEVIENDAIGDMNSRKTNNQFDIYEDGIDFYESLEGMRVKVDNAVVVGPPYYTAVGTPSYIDNDILISVLGDNGANASLRTPRGGIVARLTDFNPEIIFVDFGHRGRPHLNVGDRFLAPIVGIMDYSGENYRIEAMDFPEVLAGDLMPESKEITKEIDDESGLVIATYNVHNLSPFENRSRFEKLGQQIAVNLGSPDILAVEEIEDNDGTNKSNVVNASETYRELIEYIGKAGGPQYSFVNIDPDYNKDGGANCSNIREGFLYRTDRITFNYLSGGDAISPVNLTAKEDGAHLTFNPGRIDPNNGSFINSRKPLAAEFLFNGHKLFLIANHFNSKGGDQPLYGYNQPPFRKSELQRHNQSRVVYSFVKRILEMEPDANVVVLGDLNDYQFSDTLKILKGDLLLDAIEMLYPGEQYTYIYGGSSQALDHILVSKRMYNKTVVEPDVVHVNAEFASQTSDHDPVLISVSFPNGNASDGGGHWHTFLKASNTLT